MSLSIYAKKKKLHATLFIVSEIINSVKKQIIDLDRKGFEIASHGITHKRPLLMKKKEFLNEIINSKKTIEKIIKTKVIGFRAPCFSMNKKYLHELFKNNYLYDSSKINFKSNSLYGNFDLKDYKKISKFIYKKKKHIEFEIPTVKFANISIPFSGGGYLRLLNKNLIKYFIKKFENENQPIFFYLHPYEFSKKKIPEQNINLIRKIRMNIGRRDLDKKFEEIIEYMKRRGWKFKTFKEIYETI